MVEQHQLFLTSLVRLHFDLRFIFRQHTKSKLGYGAAFGLMTLLLVPFDILEKLFSTTRTSMVLVYARVFCRRENRSNPQAGGNLFNRWRQLCPACRLSPRQAFWLATGRGDALLDGLRVMRTQGDRLSLHGMA